MSDDQIQQDAKQNKSRTAQLINWVTAGAVLVVGVLGGGRAISSLQNADTSPPEPDQADTAQAPTETAESDVTLPGTVTHTAVSNGPYMATNDPEFIRD